MNIKKNSYMMLGLVFGVSVILYVFDTSIHTSSKIQIVPQTFIPSIIPTTQLITPTITTQSVSPTSVQITLPTTVPTSSLKRLSNSVDYTVRGIPEHIVVTITLQGTTITDLQLTQNTDNGESAAYQDAFLSVIKQSVVGKNIKDINVSRVAGASYTTDAFMQAISNIQAKI
ncbi:MAG: FMN-binding protein [Candidatus Roizmanbacteria bacterium]|nr:FMN-binding protein [Candidatus Roizmanbacteria bacterium]